jgi:hypothetical protein
MSMVPNRAPTVIWKTLAGKKMPAGTRLGTTGLCHHTQRQNQVAFKQLRDNFC